MGRPAIIEKMNNVINHTLNEPEVIYLLVGLYKFFERGNLEDRSIISNDEKILQFFRNWAAHTIKERNNTKDRDTAMEIFHCVERNEDPIECVLRAALKRINSVSINENEIIKFWDDDEKWAQFSKSLHQILVDQDLVVNVITNIVTVRVLDSGYRILKLGAEKHNG